MQKVEKITITTKERRELIVEGYQRGFWAGVLSCLIVVILLVVILG